MTLSSSRHLGAVAAGSCAAALVLGIALAAEPKLGVALLGAAAFLAITALGFTAILAAWTVAFFIPFYAVGNLLLKAGLVLTAAALIVAVVKQGSAIQVRLRQVAPFAAAGLALLAWLAASVLWAQDTATAFSELWKFGISVLIFLAIATLVDSKQAIRLLIAAFVVGALVTAMGALLGYQGGPVNSLPSEGRLQGGSGDPNVLAAAVIAGIALAAGLLKAARRPPLRVALLAAFVVFGLAAAATGSRGGIVAALAALIAALVVMRGERRAVVGLALATLSAGAVWLASSEGSWQRLTSFGDRGDGRGDLWRIAWEMFSHHPLQGVGLQNFIPTAPDYVLHPGALTFIHLITEKPVVAHNTYLQFLAETGIVGLVLFLVVVALSLTAALRAATIHERGGDHAFATLCRCVFVAAVALLAADFFISGGVDYKLWAVLGFGPAMLLLARREGAGEAEGAVVSSLSGLRSAASAGEAGSPLPRVAVVIPCFNDGATLEETLSSLDGQEACEVVVVDDGSDDPETLAALDRVRAAGTRVVSQPNRGLSAARMLGVESTAAPYIQPLDADDYLAPGSLAALADLLDADPGLGVVWGDQRTFGELDFIQKRTKELDPWAITYVNRLTAGLIRREALLEAGGWVLKVGYEDWDLWMGLAERGWRGRRIDQVTYLYRISSTRMLSGARAHHADLYGQMRARHPRLFAARRANWWDSGAPLRMRLLLPLVNLLPTAQLTRHRLQLVIAEPGHALKVRRARRRRREG
jgi:O-antigen ligase